MDNEKKPHQGEILMLLVKRSGVDGKDLAKEMGINKSYLSESFKKPNLSAKIKRAAAQVLGVDESIFEQDPGYVLPDTSSVVGESRSSYGAENGSVSQAEFTRVMEEHRKERARLLAIIEKLVEK